MALFIGLWPLSVARPGSGPLCSLSVYPPVCVFLLFTLHIGSDSAVSMHELWIKGKCLLVLMGFHCNVRVDSVRSGAVVDASCHSLPAVSRHCSGSGAVSLCDLTC